MTVTRAEVWPVAWSALRTVALVAVTLALILVVFPAVLAAAGPQVPLGA